MGCASGGIGTGCKEMYRIDYRYTYPKSTHKPSSGATTGIVAPLDGYRTVAEIAAYACTAPCKADIAVPVEVVPKGVATHIAAEGAILATAAPPATPASIASTA